MIKAEQLSYRYAGGPTLDFDNVAVGQGEVLLLSGPSGAGKSSWLALAAGLLGPSSGDIQVAGQSVAALGKAEGDQWRAKTIGFLPQKLHLSAALSVYENLALAQWAAGAPTDKQPIIAALAALGIEALAARKPRQLSGGQAQRVAVARAVLFTPQVILADEPTASLDDEATAASLQLLRQTAARTGATLVIASHDSRVWRDFEGQIGIHRLYIGRQ